ncbi:hypothetical protein, partial [Massilia genomosp. 1]|uniref:hypothetical protein n=1 Tax=Massilia genomosp. 1 TaxID=2609280 RepID=UPI001C9E4E2E
DARTVSAGATILRGSAEGGIVFDKQNNRVGYTAGLGLKAPLPVYVGPIGSVVESNTKLWGYVDGKWQWHN